MSLLFKVERRRVIPNTETLLLYPFKDIWERDTSKEKKLATEDLSYIEFCTSVKNTNPYAGMPKSQVEAVVRKDVISREDWQEDQLIKDGKAYLDKMQREGSPTYNYYMSAKKAAEKMQDFFDNFDLTKDINVKTGNPMYKPGDITRALNDTSKILKNLDDLKQKVDNEIFESTKEKGGRKESPLADPNTI